MGELRRSAISTSALVALLVAGSSCNTEVRAWPDSVRTNSMEACAATSEGDISYCGCVLDRLEQTLSLEEYIDVEAQMFQEGEMPSVALAGAAECEGTFEFAAPTPEPEQRFDAVDLLPLLDEARRDSTPEFAVDVTAWRTVPDDVFGEALCATVVYTNVGRVDGSILTFGFSLVGPNGDIKLSAFTPGGELLPQAPAIIPGAVNNTEICFNSDGDRGTFTVRYEDISWPERNGTWELVVA